VCVYAEIQGAKIYDLRTVPGKVFLKKSWVLIEYKSDKALAVAQCPPIRLASMISQLTAPQGQDEPDRNQEHNHPALATAPLRLQPATSRP
jgi:hypothetical protein